MGEAIFFPNLVRSLRAVIPLFVSALLGTLYLPSRRSIAFRCRGSPGRSRIAAPERAEVSYSLRDRVGPRLDDSRRARRGRRAWSRVGSLLSALTRLHGAAEAGASENGSRPVLSS